LELVDAGTLVAVLLVAVLLLPGLGCSQDGWHGWHGWHDDGLGCSHDG